MCCGIKALCFDHFSKCGFGAGIALASASMLLAGVSATTANADEMKPAEVKCSGVN